MVKVADKWAAGSAYEDFMGKWSRELAPKFDGRAVQVIDILTGGGQSVFRLLDPGTDGSPQFMPASSSGFRRVSMERVSGVRARSEGVDNDTFSDDIAREG